MKHVFIDSGAFSLYNQQFSGANACDYSQGNYDFIKTKKFKDYLDSYIAFLSLPGVKDMVDVYVNLDIIGNPEKTWEMQKYMESCGLKPLPVFHFGEDIKWLKKYMEGHDYIGIGGMGHISKMNWIRYFGKKVFDVICNSDGTPRFKTHGFALTAQDLMREFPWHSVDSASWQKLAGYGRGMVAKKKDGKYDFNQPYLSPRLTAIKANYSKPLISYHSSKPMLKSHIKQYVHDMGYSFGSSNMSESTDKDKKDGFGFFKTMEEKTVVKGVDNDSYTRAQFNSRFVEGVVLQNKYPTIFYFSVTRLSRWRKVISDHLFDNERFGYLVSYYFFPQTLKKGTMKDPIKIEEVLNHGGNYESE